MAKRKKKKKKRQRGIQRRRGSFAARSNRHSVLSDWSLDGKIPADVLRDYQVHEWKHAAAILQGDYPGELDDIVQVLRDFRIDPKHVLEGGKGKTKMAGALERAFADRGWVSRRWNTAIVLDETRRDSPTHEVDCVKNKVALEIEWSNKDPFYDRDLNNFRLLFDLRAISVGIIITKSDELAGLFNELGIWSKYGTTTTWMSKLLPRIEGGGGGGCPILVFGIRRSRFNVPADE